MTVAANVKYAIVFGTTAMANTGHSYPGYLKSPVGGIVHIISI